MGCGGLSLVTGNVFRMYVRFTEAATGRAATLDRKTYEWFVDQIKTIVGRGEWILDENVVLLRGPIRTTDDAHRLNRQINEVLRGLRLKQNRSSSGVIAQVIENQGPAVDGSPNRGMKHGPSTLDDLPSPP
jgi:hypothetical protein